MVTVEYLYCLLGCGEYMLVYIYQRLGDICCLCLQIGTMKMEAGGSSEILVNIYQTARRHILEEVNLPTVTRFTKILSTNGRHSQYMLSTFFG
jgi:hypothetical protein